MSAAKRYAAARHQESLARVAGYEYHPNGGAYVGLRLNVTDKGELHVVVGEANEVVNHSEVHRIVSWLRQAFED